MRGPPLVLGYPLFLAGMQDKLNRCLLTRSMGGVAMRAGAAFRKVGNALKIRLGGGPEFA
jgi:hypothetical protein